jgi:hypothetical protein
MTVQAVVMKCNYQPVIDIKFTVRISIIEII